jgi:hypothetical protein
MQYIRPLNEWLGANPKIDENPHDLEDFSGLSKEELHVLIDQAVADNDWTRVKALNHALYGSDDVTEMLHVSDMKLWIQLNESVQEAKAFLQAMAAREIKKSGELFDNELMNMPDATEEEKKAKLAELKQAILDKWMKNEDFEEIKTLFANQPKYVGPFVKFRFMQGAPMEVITNLQSVMVKYKASLDDLPKKIEEYANKKTTKEDSTPGYEDLGDDLNKLMELSRGRWLVQALPSKAMSTPAHAAAGFSPINLREAFRSAPKEKQSEILKAAAELNDLNKPALIKAVTVKLSGLPSIDEVLEYVRLQIKNSSTDRGRLMEQAFAAFPSVAVMYEGPDHVVFSFRNDSQLPTLCSKAKGWCIQPSWYNPGYADRFWHYASGSLQLGIIDFTVDPSDNHHTMGVTIQSDRRVYSMCDQPNHCTEGSDYRKLFKSFITGGKHHSYPDALIEAIDLNFDQEVKLKTASDSLYKKIKQFSEGERDKNQAMIKTFTGLIRNLNDLVRDANLSASDMSVNSNGNVAKQIVAKEIENMQNSDSIKQVRSDYISQVKTSGLVSPADVKIFDIVMKNSDAYSQTLINGILARNNEFLKVLEINTAKATGRAAEHWGIVMNGIKDANEYLKSIQATL